MNTNPPNIAKFTLGDKVKNLVGGWTLRTCQSNYERNQQFKPKKQI
jgi:hypothetical protein